MSKNCCKNFKIEKYIDFENVSVQNSCIFCLVCQYDNTYPKWRKIVYNLWNRNKNFISKSMVVN